MRITLCVTTLLGVLLAAPMRAEAQGLGQLAALATLKGKCHKLVIGGADASALCKDTVVNAAYKDGRSSFQFVAGDKAIVSFYGTDSRAKGDQAVLRIEKITLNLLMSTPPTSATASGTCTYSNPYVGPSLIQCSAASSGKTFSATFVSNGQEPSVHKF